MIEPQHEDAGVRAGRVLADVAEAAVERQQEPVIARGSVENHAFSTGRCWSRRRSRGRHLQADDGRSDSGDALGSGRACALRQPCVEHHAHCFGEDGDIAAIVATMCAKSSWSGDTDGSASGTASSSCRKRSSEVPVAAGRCDEKMRLG